MRKIFKHCRTFPCLKLSYHRTCESYTPYSIVRWLHSPVKMELLFANTDINYHRFIHSWIYYLLFTVFDAVQWSKYGIDVIHFKWTMYTLSKSTRSRAALYLQFLSKVSSFFSIDCSFLLFFFQVYYYK